MKASSFTDLLLFTALLINSEFGRLNQQTVENIVSGFHAHDEVLTRNFSQCSRDARKPIAVSVQ